MRIHPIDGLLFLSMRLLKSLDRRQTALKYFDPDKIKNILVVSSTAIGDALLSTPAIRAVRERYPHAKIIAHFNTKNMELFENNPHINGIIPYYGGYKNFFKTIREFRRHKFDLALIFHGNEPQATPMAYLSGAKFIYKIPMPKQYGFLLSNTDNGFDNPWNHHAIDVRLKTASFAGCNGQNKEMVLIVDKNAEYFIDNFLESANITSQDLIVGFQAGAATKFKMWPEAKFIELGKRLLQYKPNIKIMVIGSRDEKDLCNFIAKSIGGSALSIAGMLSLKQMGALINRLNVLVTNDTGTMHMAIALRTRTVSMFCPTNAWGVGPLQDMHLHKVIQKERPCNPCISKKCKKPFCMELISAGEVFEAVREFLS